MKPCSKCGTEPALSYHTYCYTCLRRSKGQPDNPKFRRDGDNLLCSKCKTNQRASGKNYCRECANKYTRDWRGKNGGSWACLTDEQKKKAVVRRFICHRVERGKLQRKPCFICGSPETEFHHLNYNPQTTDVIDVCRNHHEEIEELKKNGLTDSEAVSYLLAQTD